MAEYNDEKTVVVERDTANTNSPVGLIVLVVALIAIAFFLLMGGTQMFGDDTTNTTDTTTDGTNNPVDTPTTTPTPTPTPEETTPTPTTEQ